MNNYNAIVLSLLLIILLISVGLMCRQKIWVQNSLSAMDIKLGFFEYEVVSFRDLSLAYEDHLDEVILRVDACEKFDISYANLNSSNELNDLEYQYLTHEKEFNNAEEPKSELMKSFGDQINYMITYWDKKNCLFYYNYVKM